MTISMKKLCLHILIFYSFCPSQESIKDRIEVRVIKTLEKQLLHIEKKLIAIPDIDSSFVRNITMPFQNYLEDVVLASGRQADCFPQIILQVLKEKIAEKKKKKHQIAFLLVEYYINGKFEKLYNKKAQNGDIYGK